MNLIFRIATDILKSIPGFLLLAVGFLFIAVMVIDCGFTISDMFKEVLR